jgi:hydrogenase expression/formation protein HypE
LKLGAGKLPPSLLEKYVLGMAGRKSTSVALGPGIGLDFGVVRLGKKYLVASSDPVTGAQHEAGRIAVTVSANDVATSGNRPQFLLSVILFPEKVELEEVKTVTGEIHRTASSLGITILGGHTESTPGLSRTIVVTTAFAFCDAFVSAGDAKAGDTLMMTKFAAMEGTSILARESEVAKARIGPGTAERAASFGRELSVVEEAVAAYGSGGVRAMHDCTEGGVLGAAYEMSFASGVGFELFEGKVPVAPDTRRICSVLAIDPLKLIGSGSLLVAVRPGKERAVEAAVSKTKCRITRVGRFTSGERVLVKRGGERARILTAPVDELWRFVAGIAGRPR